MIVTRLRQISLLLIAMAISALAFIQMFQRTAGEFPMQYAGMLALAGIGDRKLNTLALAGLVGRGALAWEGLLADARRADAQRRLEDLRAPEPQTDAVSGAIHVGDVA